jgi:hypothetical protein
VIKKKTRARGNFFEGCFFGASCPDRGGMMKKYCRPIIAIDIPVTKNGRGPCDPSKAHHILYEVWDGAYVTICSCPDMKTAQHIAKLLDKELI